MFDRNYNPAQAAGSGKEMRRVAVGPSDDDTRYTEAVMKAWAERDWSWSMEGLSLHSYTVPQWPASLPSTDFGEGDYALILATTLKMDQRIATHSAIMDRYDPETGFTAMMRTTGYSLAITGMMQVRKQVTGAGVLTPTDVDRALTLTVASVIIVFLSTLLLAQLANSEVLDLPDQHSRAGIINLSGHQPRRELDDVRFQRQVVRHVGDGGRAVLRPRMRGASRSPRTPSGRLRAPRCISARAMTLRSSPGRPTVSWTTGSSRSPFISQKGCPH